MTTYIDFGLQAEMVVKVKVYLHLSSSPRCPLDI